MSLPSPVGLLHYHYDFRRETVSAASTSSTRGPSWKGLALQRQSLNIKNHHWNNRTYAYEANNTNRDAVKATVTVTELPEIGIPGVRNILNGSYNIWGKLIWGVVLIISTSICVYQVGDRLLYYLSYPLTAEVTNHINQSLVFPLVSLCPYNPFERDELVIQLKREVSLKHNVTVATIEDLWNYMPKESYNLELLWNLTTIYRHTLTVSQRCGFGRKADDCNFKFEIKRGFSTFFGNCWVIGKANDNDPIDYQGPLTGLTIRVNENTSLTFDQIQKYSSGDIDEQSFGYSVYIHDEDTSPKYDAFYRGLTVYHSVNTIVSLAMKKFYFLNTTQYPCSVSSVVSACWDSCIEQRIRATVPCRLPFLSDPSLPMCNGTENYNISYLGPRYIYLDATPENCHCPRRCEKIIYTPNTYTVKDPNVSNRTMIMILFQDNMFEEVKESEAFPLIAFFSDIGGTLGLFLGVCILTLGEVIEIAIVLVKECVRKKKCILSFQEG